MLAVVDEDQARLEKWFTARASALIWTTNEFEADKTMESSIV